MLRIVKRERSCAGRSHTLNQRRGARLWFLGDGVGILESDEFDELLCVSYTDIANTLLKNLQWRSHRSVRSNSVLLKSTLFSAKQSQLFGKQNSRSVWRAYIECDDECLLMQPPCGEVLSSEPQSRRWPPHAIFILNAPGDNAHIPMYPLDATSQWMQILRLTASIGCPHGQDAHLALFSCPNENQIRSLIGSGAKPTTPS